MPTDYPATREQLPANLARTTGRLTVFGPVPVFDPMRTNTLNP